MTHEEFEKIREERSDEALIEKAEKALSGLCKTGGRSYTMSVPPRLDDTDIVLSDIIRRFKSRVNV